MQSALGDFDREETDTTEEPQTGYDVHLDGTIKIRLAGDLE
jgi:hypothetical protein